MLLAEILQYTGLSNFSEPRWQYVGYAKLQGNDLDYFGIPGLRIAGSQAIGIIAVCQVRNFCLLQAHSSFSMLCSSLYLYTTSRSFCQLDVYIYARSQQCHEL